MRNHRLLTLFASGGAPSASFSADAVSIDAGDTVTFTDLSTNDPTSWSWDFGDGGDSTDQNPSHQYDDSGLYTVTLTATNEFGSDEEVKTNYILVLALVGQWDFSNPVQSGHLATY